MQSKEFLKLAISLQNQTDSSEARYRTVVGRWYYSAFHEVLKWLESDFSKEYNACTGNTHIRLTNCCNELQRKKMDLNFSKLGRLIKEFHDRRVIADYKLGKIVISSDMEEAQLNYESVLEILDILKAKYSKDSNLKVLVPSRAIR